jgi:hypothetical protein
VGVEEGDAATGKKGGGGVGPHPCQLSLYSSGIGEGTAPRLFFYTLLAHCSLKARPVVVAGSHDRIQSGLALRHVGCVPVGGMDPRGVDTRAGQDHRIDRVLQPPYNREGLVVLPGLGAYRCHHISIGCVNTWVIRKYCSSLPAPACAMAPAGCSGRGGPISAGGAYLAACSSWMSRSPSASCGKCERRPG